MKYLPFLDGKYSTAPALTILTKAEEQQDRCTFQVDDQYDQFRENKQNCRKEDINKYYCEAELHPETIAASNRQIVTLLINEYPEVFELSANETISHLHNKKTGERFQWNDDWITIQHDVYTSLFDALSCQVQEDLVICQLDGDRDWLAAIHLTAPNHWSPTDKIGKPFGAVHQPVPGMEKLNQQYFKMLVIAVQKGPFFRFAWGISTDKRLNHHPIAPPDKDPVDWAGRKIEPGNDAIYLRVERQTITGIPSCNAFLFTIRTYFYDILELDPDEKKALYLAVKSMSAASLEYKGLTDKVEILENWLLS